MRKDILRHCRDETNLPTDSPQWYKFDDTDVSDCKMDDEEELRSQCFGGDYPTQSFDQPVMKRYIFDSVFCSLIIVKILDNVDGGMLIFSFTNRLVMIN